MADGHQRREPQAVEALRLLHRCADRPPPDGLHGPARRQDPAKEVRPANPGRKRGRRSKKDVRATMVRRLRGIRPRIPLLGAYAHTDGRCGDRERRPHLHRRVRRAAQARDSGVRGHRQGCGRRPPAGRELPDGALFEVVRRGRETPRPRAAAQVRPPGVLEEEHAGILGCLR
nr:MAG TPA: hypothetical protein [Caudoviricetes sp.]